MSWEDKLESQAQAYREVDDYAAGPLDGPGRWAHIHAGMTIYTDDDNILFAKGDLSTIEASTLFQAMYQLYKAGKTAGEAFDIIRMDYRAVSGDLSELA